jgi:hypothetical protein
MVHILADIVKIIMFAASTEKKQNLQKKSLKKYVLPNTFLRIHHTHILVHVAGRIGRAEKKRFELSTNKNILTTKQTNLIHARIGKQQRWVIVWNCRTTVHVQMRVLLAEIIDERLPHSVRTHLWRLHAVFGGHCFLNSFT